MPRPPKSDEPRFSHLHDYNIDPATNTIYLHSQGEDKDGEENGVNYAMAVNFCKNMDYLNSKLKEGDFINVSMMNIGGDYYYGMTIFDAIKNSIIPVHMYAYSYVTSMGSVILQAAPQRYISKNAAFMIHNGSYADCGDLKKVQSGIDFYKEHNIMYDIYAERCMESEFNREHKIKSLDKMKEFIKNQVKEKSDWWLTAEETVYYGFADEIV